MLGEDGPHPSVRCVDLHDVLARGVWLDEDRCRGEPFLELHVCCVCFRGPGEVVVVVAVEVRRVSGADTRL